MTTLGEKASDMMPPKIHTYDYMAYYLAGTEGPNDHVCDCCRRHVDKVRGSNWHGASRICSECFIEWYDGDRPITCEADLRDPIAIGNWVRKRHGLPPLADAPARARRG